MSKKRSKTRAKTRAKNRIPAPPHLAARVAAYQKRLRRSGLDGQLLVNANDIKYLTGFCGEDSWCFVPARGDGLTVLTDGRFKTHVPGEAPHVGVELRAREGKRFETLEELAARLYKGRKLGLNPGQINHAWWERTSKALGARRLVAHDDGLLRQRGLKDARELKCLRRAVDIQQRALLATRRFIKPGMTELEVCAYLEYQMKKLGAEGPGFGTIVAVDGHASHNHAIPGDLRIKKNSSLLIDWGACVGGYRSDMTRVLNLGKPKPHIARIYNICLEAMRAAEALLKPGTALADLDHAARSLIESHGHTLDHGLGHGIGLNIHEFPGIGKQKDVVLEPGMVITIEPGIYLGDKGGVRLENDYLITAKGYECLCDLPVDLEWSVI